MMRQAKRTSWKNFISKISSNTPSWKIWNMLYKIQGKDITQPVQRLKINNNIVSNTEEPA